MAAVLVGLVAIIIGCCLLRWGYMYVVKRQRIDMASERKRIQEDAIRGFRINKQVARWLWKRSDWRSK
jgi:hypothetical protein